MSDHVEAVLRQGLLLAAWLGAPVLVAALVSGVVVNLLRASTAWQDVTLSYVPRLLFVGASWVLTGPWIARELLTFARLAWGGAP